MARVCSVCSYPDQGAVDRALVSGTPIRDIAGQHALGKSAVDRHRSQIGAALVKAAERQDAAEDALADALLAQARKLNRMVWEALEAARGTEPRDWAALAVVLQKQLVLQATLLKAAGQAPDGAVVYSWRRSSAHEPGVLPAIAERH